MARSSIQEYRWFPRNQPQTLLISAALLYWNAILGLFVGLIGHGTLAHFTLLLAILEAIGAFGIANHRKAGYVVSLCGALPALALFFPGVGGFLGGGFYDFIFQLALVILLLHEHTRSYVKSWFH